jgi:hypothetical protein
MFITREDGSVIIEETGEVVYIPIKVDEKMYKINSFNGSIENITTGEIILPPYNDNILYIEYANWIEAGGVPEVVNELIVEVPQSITRFQAKSALLSVGLLETVESLMLTNNVPHQIKLAWTDAQVFYRTSPALNSLASVLGMTSEDLDNLFILGASIEA